MKCKRKGLGDAWKRGRHRTLEDGSSAISAPIERPIKGEESENSR